MSAAPDTILFIPPKTLAGAARALAPAREVRRAHRKAKLVCLTTERLAPLFEASPYFNAVDPDGDPENSKESQALMRRLRNTEYGAVYDFRGTSMSDRLIRRLKPKPDFISEPSAAGAAEGLHPLERMERQLVAAGVLDAPVGLLPDMSWLSAVARRTRTLEPAYFGLNENYAVLLPCAASREKSPAFKPEEWAALASALLEQGLRPVVLGSVADRAIANAVRGSAPQAKEFLGRTNLLQLASLSRHARLVISAGAPPADLAAAAAADLVMVYTDADPDPRLTAPRGEGSIVALTPSASRVSVGDVMQSARALGAFRRQNAPVDA